MTTITIPLSDDVYSKMEHFSWVKWSEIARNSLCKRAIFERYIKSGELSDKEAEFCDKIDWHPVDELSLREEFIQKLNNLKKEVPQKVKDVSDIFD